MRAVQATKPTRGPDLQKRSHKTGRRSWIGCKRFTTLKTLMNGGVPIDTTTTHTTINIPTITANGIAQALTIEVLNVLRDSQ